MCALYLRDKNGLYGTTQRLSTDEWLWEGLGAAPGLAFTLHARRVGVYASAWAVNVAPGDDVKEFWVCFNVWYFCTDQAIDDFWTVRLVVISENE